MSIKDDHINAAIERIHEYVRLTDNNLHIHPTHLAIIKTELSTMWDTLNNNLVVQPWFINLTFKQQTVILSALRGCDGKCKEDISKKITRFYRSIILKNADNTSSFMTTQDIITFKNDFDNLLSDVDSYPIHFIFHLTHGIEIIGYHHPEDNIRQLFHELYCKTCKALHVNIESKKELDERLKDIY